ncbi:MAG: hypothetical protein KAV83_04860 [Desulfobacterales bacterium]|nr:hypothetical protein [Desulfobacterales bacterium]
MDYGIIATLITVILGVLTLFLGAKVRKVKALLAGTLATFDKIDEALKDNKLTKEEVKAIRQAWQDVINDAKQIFRGSL